MSVRCPQTNLQIRILKRNPSEYGRISSVDMYISTKYLKEMGWSVDVTMHFNAWNPESIKSFENTLLIDAAVYDNPVQFWGMYDMDIPNANYRIRKKSDKNLTAMHRDLIDSGDIWDTSGKQTWNSVMNQIKKC